MCPPSEIDGSLFLFFPHFAQRSLISTLGPPAKNPQILFSITKEKWATQGMLLGTSNIFVHFLTKLLVQTHIHGHILQMCRTYKPMVLNR